MTTIPLIDRLLEYLLLLAIVYTGTKAAYSHSTYLACEAVLLAAVLASVALLSLRDTLLAKEIVTISVTKQPKNAVRKS